MADFKERVESKFAEIKKIASNEQEASKILACVTDIIDAFSDKLLEVSKRQIQLEERTEEVFEMLSNIEEELVQAMMADFKAECPYCGAEVSAEIPEDGSDFECPKCHNIIELEMMFDDCGCDCGCDDCGCDDCDDCDCDCEDCDCCDCDDCDCDDFDEE